MANTVKSTASAGVAPSAGGWDTFIRRSTAQYGPSSIPKNGPASGTGFYAEQPSMQQQQLSLRRQIDNKIRYGQEVTPQEMKQARDIGAISGGPVQTGLGLGNVSFEF